MSDKSTTASIEPNGFFVMRTPLLPFDELAAWSEGLEAPAAVDDPALLAAKLAADRQRLRERLRALVTRPDVREALFVASPSLCASLAVWLSQPESERGQKVERTLVRYFARMASRATPFGLFAGCSLGHVGDVTTLELEARDRYRRHTRLDGDYLATLTTALGSAPELRRALTYRPSSSLFRIAGQLRYAEATVKNKKRSYRLVVVEPTPYLEATLARAAGGARLDELAAALVDDEVTAEDAVGYVAQLVDSQLLVSDLEPQVTGDEPIHDVIAQLRAAAREHEPSARVAETLAAADAALRALDDTPLGADPTRYDAIANRLTELPVEVEPALLFQVDMVKPTRQATLGPEPLAELARAVALLHRLAAPSREEALHRFRDAFVNRYEQQEVPLVEVLDEESGIGFDRSSSPAADASPLLAGLAFASDAADGSGVAGPYFALLLGKLQECLARGGDEIRLDEADVSAMAESAQRHRRADPAPLPSSLAVQATLSAISDEAIAAGDFRLLVNGVMGPSGATMLGRFCHADPALTEAVRGCLRDEEARHPEAIFAEVVHLPEGRIGNILLRPLLREWELAYLGRSGAPRDRQLTLDDLLVSVRDGRIVLRSRRHGREVIPRLTSAHNFGGPAALGAYRFLGTLQHQHRPSLGFDWGALEAATFLPRVTAGRLVLSLARWRLDAGELRALAEAKGAQQFVEAQALRRRHRLPRWVAVTDRDNVLPIDLDNTLSIETFVQLVKERQQLTLRELFGAGERCARGPEGRFMNELVIPFKTVPAAAVQPLARPAVPSLPASTASRIQRRLPPGSEWLYAKLYTGSATVDVVLRELIAPVVSAARQTGAADSWFFIRYGDPEWHVRVRFHGVPDRLRNEVLPALETHAAAAVDAGRIWRVQLDTYEREIERYGGDEGMLASEQLFCADSDAALHIVAQLSGDDGKDAAWRLTLRGMDQLLDDLGLSLEDKHALLRRCRQQYAREFHAERGLAKQIGDKFRQERLALEALLDRGRDAGSELAPALRAFDHRSPRVRAIAATLRREQLPELAASWLHMHANRMLAGPARAQELVLYDFLERLYDGRLARLAKRRA